MTTKIRLALEWFLNPDHVPFLVGLEQGWFLERGIDLELVEPSQHLDAAAALAQGTIDVAITEPIHLVQDRIAGRDVVGFCRFLHTNGGVMFPQGRGISRPRDMAGKRVQYPGAPGPGGRAIVATMIEADGGKYDPTSLSPVNNGFFHTSALIEDKADVATLAFYNFELMEAKHRGLDASFFALKDWGVPDFCQLILMTRSERFAAERQFFAALTDVVRRGIDFLKMRPEEAERIYVKRTGQRLDNDDGRMLRAMFSATVPCFTYDFTMADAYWVNLAAWVERTGQGKPSIDGLWDNALALR